MPCRCTIRALEICLPLHIAIGAASKVILRLEQLWWPGNETDVQNDTVYISGLTWGLPWMSNDEISN